jgi:endonuclease/exonuclease/phosphatase family metal-dependent hydrolase
MIAAFIIVLLGYWLLNVSTPGTKIASCLTACAPAPSPPDSTYTVVSWNILHGFPNFENLPERLDQVIAILQANPADFILLQEVPFTLKTGNAAVYLAKQLGMNYVFVRANGNRFAIGFEEGAAIFSRYPLSKPRVYELAPSAGFFENRIVLQTIAITPHGDITLYSTHLTNGDTVINQGQATHLQTIVAENSTGMAIIGGDFNARPSSPQIKSLQPSWLDSFTISSIPQNDKTCCLDLSAPNPTEHLLQRIDYIFLGFRERESLTVLDYQTLSANENPQKSWPSDHLAVWVSIEFKDD